MAGIVSKRGHIAPFIAMDVMRQAHARTLAGNRTLHLEVGQPSTPAPSAVLDAAVRALASSALAYTEAVGIDGLRVRIARHYGESYGIDVDWHNVVVTAGSSGAFLLAFLAAFDAGDRVAVPFPGYPAYRNILSALNVEVVPLVVGPSTRFQPTPAQLDEARRRAGGHLDGLIVASPANPTGTMLQPDTLRALADWCADHRVRWVSDEIYHGITFDQPAQTALACRGEAIVINSFSKYYSMTGWRLGWMVVPSGLVRAVECLAQNLFICPPALSQVAAIAAFDCTHELAANVRRYAANRAMLLDRLPCAGFRSLAPADGAFYAYAELASSEETSQSVCGRMLTEVDVAATPGIDFDPINGDRYVRFSFAGTTADIAEATDRMIAWRASQVR